CKATRSRPLVAAWPRRNLELSNFHLGHGDRAPWLQCTRIAQLASWNLMRPISRRYIDSAPENSGAATTVAASLSLGVISVNANTSPQMAKAVNRQTKLYAGSSRSVLI